jgi:hypothetical protein
MKKVTIPFLLLAISLTLSSCLGNSEKKKSEDSDFRTESALGLYEIQVPKFMTATTGLNSDASMQFQNIYKETYLAVIEESKDEFIDTFKELGEYDEAKSASGNYQTIQMNFFSEGMNVNRMGTPKKIKINGMDAEQVEFVGRVPEIDFDIYYLMTFIEGAETLYMVMEWTLSNNEDTYKDTFKEMADSFKEI